MLQVYLRSGMAMILVSGHNRNRTRYTTSAGTRKKAASYDPSTFAASSATEIREWIFRPYIYCHKNEGKLSQHTVAIKPAQRRRSLT